MFGHWAPPYYARVAFGLSRSCLLNVNYIFFPLTSLIDIFYAKRRIQCNIIYGRRYIDTKFRCMFYVYNVCEYA